MSSIVKENYLKALYFLHENGEDITVTKLGAVMQVSKPTVNDMVKKMQAIGYVHYERYKPLKLTEDGRVAAALVIRKHRLAEMFLCEIMGFGWEEVHDIAEELEHIKSSNFFDRMDEIMGFPTVDPHGSPIPDRFGTFIKPDYVALSSLKEGQVGILRALRNSSSEFLSFLNKKNLKLGTHITLDSLEKFDGSATVSYLDFKKVALSHRITQNLLVELA